MTVEQEINDIVSKLHKIEHEIAEEINRKTLLKRAGKIALTTVKAKTPVRTGNLKKSMQFLPFNKSKNAVFVGPNYRRGGSHAHLVERGWIDRSGKRHPGRPFIRETYEQTKGQVLENLKKELQKLIEKSINQNKR